MSFSPQQEHLAFRDAKGNIAHMSYYTFSDTAAVDFPHHAYIDALAVEADILPLTNAVLVSAVGPLTIPTGPLTYGVAATYQDVIDKAVLVFQDSDGIQHTMQIPAPVSSMFLADSQTVDPTAANVKQLIADVLHTTFGGTVPTVGTFQALSGRAGIQLTQYVGGYRRRGKLIKRTNIKVRAATEIPFEPEE